MQDYVWSTSKLLLLVVVVSLLCGYAYGWVIGVKVLGVFSVVVVIAQSWSCRKDIAQFIRRADDNGG